MVDVDKADETKGIASRRKRKAEGASARSSENVDIAHPATEVLEAFNAELLTVLKRVKKGDFSARLPLKGDGIQLMIAENFNDLVELLTDVAGELERAGHTVGKEGRIKQRVSLPNAYGSWASSINSINTLIDDLTQPIERIAQVIGAVAQGDLLQKIPLEHDGVPLKGEFLRIGSTVNTMVDRLGSFASEVTRVAREVGTEGRLGGQAVVDGVAGTWKDLTDSVNSMAGNLTGQVRNIAEVTTAVANGDLSKKITVDVKGEILELKNTINTMVDQLNSFASEVTRVAREVGTEGRLGGQAVVRGVGGTWKDLTDSVNSMAGNLTAQVRNIAEVTTAVANGDLSKKITVDVKGEILELKNTINTMVDQLSSFASEVTRVAREVGTEGRLGGQAVVSGVGGTWKDLTDSVNSMAGNLTAQVRNIAEVTTAVANGDLSKKITVDVKGEILELKNTIDTMVDQLSSFASEVTRVAREVGTEGRLGGQAVVRGVGGTWKDLTDSVNSMAGNLTAQVRNIAEVTTAVANGDLSKKITVDVKGEILELKNTINTMVDQLSSFASEVTRVAREVGTEGKLGGQAVVKDVAGVWKNLTDSVNSMAGNLTSQVRGIAKVVTAVANGDLKRKLVLEAKGEIAALADTINEMNETLAIFAEQVTSVAREVGIEGKLGGQAKVPGASGTWKGLTENVNQLAANLTTQVRAIAEVATAVTKGDLTRSIDVEAQGEVAALKDNINEMIRNLKDTTQKNTEQDWLKTNLAKFTRMLQGQRDLMTVTKLILSELASVVHAQHGVFYMMDSGGSDNPVLRLSSSYAYKERKSLSNCFKIGEGLVGQCAYEKQMLVISDVPSDYVRIGSGLGEATPLSIVVLPVLFEEQVMAVIELASFQRFKEIHLTFLDQLTETVGIVLNTIASSMRTEDLLEQSQSLAQELQSQQEELREKNARLERQAASLRDSEDLLRSRQEELKKANENLEEKANQLFNQKAELESKNREIELAKLALQDRAEQLALTSKYKSEFLANMSHELRTPLNSLLILAETLSENRDGNLSSKQLEFVQTIYGAGSDLLSLINDILDMAKIESGTIAIDVGEARIGELAGYVQRIFTPVAENKDLSFSIEVSERLSDLVVHTDVKRLQQVFRNLLSNAFKFTELGSVTFKIETVQRGWSVDHAALAKSGVVFAFSVIDTGIGIAQDKQKIIFEPFQQADMGTSRRFAGTGLGLSISREIARLLGGEIRVESTVGKGSAFTLYLPQMCPVGIQRQSGTPWGSGESPRAQPWSFLPPPTPPSVAAKTSVVPEVEVEEIEEAEDAVLIVEHNPTFASVLRELAAEFGFRSYTVGDGRSAIELANRLKPAAITLDLNLPDVNGLVVLDYLKQNQRMQHVPVIIISGKIEINDYSRRLGSFLELGKPVTRNTMETAFSKVKRLIDRPKRELLLLCTDEAEGTLLTRSLGEDRLAITVVYSEGEAIDLLKQKAYECIAVHDRSGEAFPQFNELELESAREGVTLAYYSELVAEERFDGMSHAPTVMRCFSYPEFLHVVSLALHRPLVALPPETRSLLERACKQDILLRGKRVLVVDDDARNVFAITSLLERWELDVLRATDGRDALAVLNKEGEVDLVLMDVMMPEMDGYETMKAIRNNTRFSNLPIIAVTAKALKGDREKCIAAGASEYISKPIDSDQLKAMLRVFLAKSLLAAKGPIEGSFPDGSPAIGD